MDNGQNEYPPLSLKETGYFRVTSRPYDSYQRIFSFDIKSLSRKAKVLDIGSGNRQEFSRGLRGKRPDIFVFSVDPTLSLPVKEEDLKKSGIKYEIYNIQNQDISSEAQRVNRIKEALPGTLIALAPHLPFADNSFEAVFDNHSAFMYLPERDNLHQQYLEEIMRTLKPAGTAYVYPLDLYDEAQMEETEKLEASRKRVEKIIQNLGIKQYELFSYDDRSHPDHPSNIRLGIKFTKK